MFVQDGVNPDIIAFSVLKNGLCMVFLSHSIGYVLHGGVNQVGVADYDSKLSC